MKDDNFEMSFDGICIYIALSVENPLMGKIFLITADLIIFGVFFTAIYTWIPGLALVSLAFLFFLLRYTLWNFFGSEYIIINTKAISYQHDYGFIRMPRVTKSINKILQLKYDSDYLDKDQIKVKLNMVSYDENDLPIIIYQVSLPVSLQNAERLDALIKQIFMDKMSDDYSLPNINLN